MAHRGEEIDYSDHFFFDERPNIGSNETLRIHMVAHSHNDVGWDLTFNEAYYGVATSVEFILDTVTQNLEVDERRKFIEVEIAFFERWFSH